MYYFIYVILPKFRPYAKYIYLSLLGLALVLGLLLIYRGAAIEWKF